MEKGESLDVWAASTGDGLDMVTGLQVCMHVPESDVQLQSCRFGRGL